MIAPITEVTVEDCYGVKVVLPWKKLKNGPVSRNLMQAITGRLKSRNLMLAVTDRLKYIANNRRGIQRIDLVVSDEPEHLSIDEKCLPIKTTDAATHTSQVGKQDCINPIFVMTVTDAGIVQTFNRGDTNFDRNDEIFNSSSNHVLEGSLSFEDACSVAPKRLGPTTITSATLVEKCGPSEISSHSPRNSCPFEVNPHGDTTTGAVVRAKSLPKRSRISNGNAVTCGDRSVAKEKNSLPVHRKVYGRVDKNDNAVGFEPKVELPVEVPIPQKRKRTARTHVPNPTTCFAKKRVKKECSVEGSQTDCTNRNDGRKTATSHKSNDRCEEENASGCNSAPEATKVTGKKDKDSSHARSVLDAITDPASRNVLFVDGRAKNNTCLGFIAATSNNYCESPFAFEDGDDTVTDASHINPHDVVRFAINNTTSPLIVVLCNYMGVMTWLNKYIHMELVQRAACKSCKKCVRDFVQPAYVSMKKRIPYCQHRARETLEHEDMMFYRPTLVWLGTSSLDVYFLFWDWATCCWKEASSFEHEATDDSFKAMNNTARLFRVSNIARNCQRPYRFVDVVRIMAKICTMFRGERPPTSPILHEASTSSVKLLSTDWTELTTSEVSSSDRRYTPCQLRFRSYIVKDGISVLQN